MQRSCRPTLVTFASTRPTQKPTSTTIIKGCTKPSLAFGCACACKENPKSFINHQQMTKHQKIHENVSCPDCNKSFGARRNMQRHIKNVHKARNDNETSRNSNGSHTDENFNEDPIDIDNVPFDIVF